MTGTRAAVLRAFGEAPALQEITLEPLQAGEVRVRIAGVGICHTDLTAIDGHVPLPLPAVLGHEGAGTVEATGPGVTALAPGDTVVLTYDACGGCPACASGRPAYCSQFAQRNSSGLRPDGTTTLRGTDGPVHGSFLAQSSFATHAIATERNAVTVTTGLPPELLGPLGCSLMTGAGAVLNVLAPEPGSSLAVFGCGAVGLAAVMAARAAGCGTVVAVEPDPQRRALAVELGADEARAPDDDRRLRGLDHTVETVGTAAVVGAAIAALGSPGRCVTLGFRGPRNPVEIDQGRLLFGRSLIGVIEGDGDPQATIRTLIALQADGRFPFERMLTTYPLDALATALDDTRAGRVVKAVLVP